MMRNMKQADKISSIAEGDRGNGSKMFHVMMHLSFYLYSQLIVPVFQAWRKSFHCTDGFQLATHTLGGFLSGFIIIQTKMNGSQGWNSLHQFKYRLDRGAAAGNIAVFLPIA